MALKRNVSVIEGLKYKGGGPMFAWILHRVSGLVIVLFIGFHVLSAFYTQQAGSDWAIAYNTFYENVYFQVFVYFCVIFHALNGLRIVILDAWPKLVEYQHEVIWLQWLILIPLYGLTIFIMLQRTISGG